METNIQSRRHLKRHVHIASHIFIADNRYSCLHLPWILRSRKLDRRHVCIRRTASAIFQISVNHDGISTGSYLFFFFFFCTISFAWHRKRSFAKIHDNLISPTARRVMLISDIQFKITRKKKRRLSMLMLDDVSILVISFLTSSYVSSPIHYSVPGKSMASGLQEKPGYR